MKKIKDIMKEMTILSEQIAVSLNTEDETDIDLEDEVETQTKTHPQTPSCAMNTQTTCANVDSNVPFCAVINLPNNFVPVINPKTKEPTPKIIYDLSCLKVVAESCCCNGIPKWDIRVVGSISFVVNVDIKTTCTNCVVPKNTTVAACGSNSVCVNKVICNKCSYEDAIITRSNIKFNCDTVTVPDLKASFTSGDCFVKVTGTFRLPSCN